MNLLTPKLSCMGCVISVHKSRDVHAAQRQTHPAGMHPSKPGPSGLVRELPVLAHTPVLTHAHVARHARPCIQTPTHGVAPLQSKWLWPWKSPLHG